LFLPWFNDLALKNLTLPLTQPSFYGALIVAVGIVGFLAGLYPSFFLRFAQDKKIGFRKDQVIVVHEAHLLENHAQAFKDEALQNSSITSGTMSGYLPVSGTWRNNNTYWPEGKTPTGDDIETMVSMQSWFVDYDYIKTLGMNIKTGRSFSGEFLSDSTEKRGVK
jgi:putative ABC transport system permease protein